MAARTGASEPAAQRDGLFGRDAELEVLEGFVRRSAEAGGALVVFGEPGVGKTALVDAVAQSANSAGSRVVRAAGVQFEADMPFSTLHQLLLPLHEEFADLDVPHRAALDTALGFAEGGAAERMVVSNAALTVLRRAAVSRPLMMIVDDLPWLDRASAAVLGFVARRLGGSRVACLATARTGERGFFESVGLAELELEPLDDDAARRLLSTRFPGLDAEVRRRVLAEACGNPLALLELPRTLSNDPLTAPGLSAVVPMTRRLQGLFASRIEQLAPSSRRLVLLAALDGTGDPRVLETLGPDSEGLQELAEAERRGIVRVNPGSYRLVFRHPLIRSAIVELSTAEERKRAHEKLAEVFAEQPDRRAWHLGAATTQPDEHVAHLLEAAAHRILHRGDAVGAVAALMRAAELSPSIAKRNRRLAAAAYIGADVAGELQKAKQVLADSHAVLGGSLQAAVTAAHLLLNSDGDVDTGHRLLAGALENRTGPEDVQSGTVAEALYTLMLMCFFGGRALPWTQFYAAVDRCEPDVPDVVQLSAAMLADPARTALGALPELEAAVARLAEEPDPTRIVRTALAAAFVDRLPGCRAALRRVERDGREGGAVASSLMAQMLLGRDLFWAGDWAAARSLAEDAVRRCETHGYVMMAWPGRHMKALIAAARGNYAEADAEAEAMVQWAAPRRAELIECYAAQVRTLAALSRGDFEHAYETASTISPAGELAAYRPYALLVHFKLIEAAVRTGRRDEAKAHLAAIRQARIARLSSRLALLASASSALLAADDEAAGRFEQALALPEASAWRFDFARVQLLYGERLRRTRRAAEARAPLRAALETFEGLGAEPWTHRAASELRATGESRQRERDRDTLTTQERKIALLAASGLTNKQIGQKLFLSPRTVGFHLYRVFPKLGITSRAALRDALSAVAAEEGEPATHA
ncbi:MAG: AAA family ATPase [Solirubrobacteraceae bacterium]